MNEEDKICFSCVSTSNIATERVDIQSDIKDQRFFLTGEVEAPLNRNVTIRQSVAEHNVICGVRIQY